jgi:hypothetical protein
VKKDEFNYEKLWSEFGRLGGVKFQDSAYFIDLNNTAKEVKDHFLQHMHDNDRLMVVEFTERPAYNKAFKGTNDWVDERWPT